MQVFCLILFILIAASWFFVNEYPTVFGIYVPTCVMKRIYFKIIVAVCLLATVYTSVHTGIPDSILSHMHEGSIDSRSMLIIMLSAVIILMMMNISSIKGSAVYAILGAMEAYRINSGTEGDIGFLLPFIAAPLAAFLISSAIRLILRHTLEKCRVHLITLSYYMRFAVLAGLILTSCAIGLNWGGFLVAGAALTGVSNSVLWIILPILAVIILLLSSAMRKGSDHTAGKYGDFSIYSVITIGYSVALTFLLFSFDIIPGLDPVPLAAGPLVLSAIAGCEVAQKNRIIGNDEYTREGIASIMVPLGALLTALILFRLSDGKESIVDFTVMSIAVLIMVSLFFITYLRHQKKQKEATERLVYSQQQQIYENSKALNDMELKVVLSENQALHNSVEMKRQEVMNVALSIVEQREYLESLNVIVKKLSKSSDERERDRLISEMSASLKQRLSYDRDVDSQYFYAQAESLHEDFNAKLSENFPHLTQQERRLATLLRLGFSSKYIATLMNITPKSVEISRYRLRQKLGLGKGDNLVNFIKSI